MKDMLRTRLVYLMILGALVLGSHRAEAMEEDDRIFEGLVLVKAMREDEFLTNDEVKDLVSKLPRPLVSLTQEDIEKLPDDQKKIIIEYEDEDAEDSGTIRTDCWEMLSLKLGDHENTSEDITHVMRTCTCSKFSKNNIKKSIHRIYFSDPDSYARIVFGKL